MSEIRIVRDYAYPVTTVWRALTDSELIPLWTATGAGGLGRVRRKMLSDGLPAVLADMGDDGRLRPGSTLRARSLAGRRNWTAKQPGRRPDQHVAVALGGAVWRAISSPASGLPAARLERARPDVADATGRLVCGARDGVLAGSGAGPVVVPAPYIHVPVP